MDRPQELLKLLEQVKPHPRILVVGDLMLDRYTYGSTDRISPEAPVIVLRSERREDRLGGAASVCNMLSELGADVTCLGIVGNDLAGEQLLDQLQQKHIVSERVVVDDSRPTSLKERFVGCKGSGLPSQILRVDTEATSDLPSKTQNGLIDHCRGLDVFDAILISDYGKGVCSVDLVQTVIQTGRRYDVPVLVDPGRDQNYDLYRNAFLIKPNRLETKLATSQDISSATDAFVAGKKLCDEYEIDCAVITLDSDGMCLVDKNGSGAQYPTMARSVYDITGAGDMVLTMLGLCAASGMSTGDSVQLANFAAGMEVDQIGVTTISRSDLRNKLSLADGRTKSKCVDMESVARLSIQHRSKGKTIVFTNGCFDLLHVGHVTYLEEAARLGDVLIVGVNSDSSVRRLKGPDRPIISQDDRVAMLASLACVDHVVLFDANTPCELLEALRPDFLVKGGTYTKQQVVGHEIVEAYGGKIVLAEVLDGVSTTRILESVTSRTKLQKAG